MGNGSLCGCCKKTDVNVVAKSLKIVAEKQQGTPNGYGRFYPGARTSDNHYTCPVLSICTWRISKEKIRTQLGDLSSTDGSGGNRLNQSRTTTVLNETGMKVEQKLGLDMEIKIIPVEDILSIKVESEVKKEVALEKTRRIRSAQPEELTCGQSIKKCCFRHICCCCCHETEVAPEHVVTENEQQKATRCILVTIKHLLHSLVDTPSNVRVLSAVKQAEFYDAQLKVETLKFYYLNNEQFQEQEYDSKLRQSEVLARTVMQLKSMIGHYPDANQLEQLIKQSDVHQFGFEPKEHIQSERALEVKMTTMKQTEQP